MVTALFDVILKCIAIAALAMFTLTGLIVCIVVIGVALKDRKEQKRVHSVSEHRD